MKNILLILSSVALNALAQLFVRQGMLKIGSVSLEIGQLWNMVLSFFTNLYLWGGMLCYAVSLVLWMVVLSKVNVSLAYPFSCVGFIITAVLAYFFLNEPLTLQKCIGIAVICLGVIILTYSKDFTS